jgi:predicted SnoaL-like aldol condensation-catalyzing enzyme
MPTKIAHLSREPLHGRFSGFGKPVNWIAADIVRIADGMLAEHWDVIQDEATQE